MDETTSPEKVAPSKKKKSNLSDELLAKMSEVVNSVNVMMPVVKQMEENLPGLLKMKTCFEKESEQFQNVDHENEKDESVTDENQIECESELAEDTANEDSLARQLAFGKVNKIKIEAEAAECISGILENGMDKSQLKEVTDKYGTPKNCERMTTVPTDHSVEALNSKAKYVDKQLIKIQKVMVSGLSAISQCLTAVNNGENVSADMITEATMMFAHCSHSIDKQRRQCYLSCFNNDYSKQMIAEEFPIKGKLFGENFNETIKNISDSIRHTNKIKSRSSSFFFRHKPYNYRERSTFLERNRFNHHKSRYPNFTQSHQSNYPKHQDQPKRSYKKHQQQNRRKY